ncbi:VWA domain-containing protein [Propionivibrio soli]|uniref:VWA domain-containing protein n=1 Tax=Propionivibrio soli TaxID=2976531 RepID=UPI0021E9071D|nr:VWA domain-containing protein [Propionivibrio soli]
MIKSLNRAFARFIVCVAVTATSFGAWAAPMFQLGFALDGSGSVGTTSYNLLRSGLNAALAAIPADGTIEITVVKFGTTASTVVAPTVLTAASLSTIQSAISSHAKAGGSTNTSGAINLLSSLMTGSSFFSNPGVTSLINMATDGQPTAGGVDPQAAAVAAAVAAAAAGIDAMSIEAIGSGLSSDSALNNMAAIAFPGPVTILPVNSTTIPNPLGGSFVVPVSDYATLAPVLRAKVIASVGPTPIPEPATLLLVAIGLAALGLVQRRRA